MQDTLVDYPAAIDDLELIGNVLPAPAQPWPDEVRPHFAENAILLRNLSERHRTEAEYYKSILGSIPQGVLVLNSENRPEYVNSTALGICLKSDRSIETFIQRYDHLCQALDEFRRGHKPGPILLETDQGAFEAEFFLLSPRPQKIGIMLVDAAQRTALEREHFEEKRNLMMQLAGGIAHEIANQLFPIQGRAQLVSMMLQKADAGLNPEISKSVRVIEEQVQRINRIVEDLRHLSRPAPPQFERLDLSAILRKVVDVLSATAGKIRAFQPSEQAPYRLKASYCPQPLVVLADADQLHRALMNLIINAAHAIEEVGHGVLSIGTSSHEGRAIAFVEDTGPGIPPQMRQKIFDPYFTAKGQGKGTGLGLTIVKSIVLAHDGELNLQSEIGQGTRFEIRLPLAAHTD